MYDLSIGFKRVFLLSVYPLAYLTVDHFPWEIIHFLYLPGIYLYIYIYIYYTYIHSCIYIYNYVSILIIVIVNLVIIITVIIYIYMGLFEHGV